jgi:hypothetical protein
MAAVNSRVNNRRPVKRDRVLLGCDGAAAALAVRPCLLPAGALSGAAADPPPTQKCRLGAGFILYIPTQPYDSVKFRLLFLNASNKVRGARRRYGRLKHQLSAGNFLVRR